MQSGHLCTSQPLLGLHVTQLRGGEGKGGGSEGGEEGGKFLEVTLYLHAGVVRGQEQLVFELGGGEEGGGGGGGEEAIKSRMKGEEMRS